MCRLFAISSEEPLSPMVAMDAMDAMREGHDGSGVGLLLRDLSGPFEDMRDAPILAGIFSKAGLRRLDEVLMDIGFRTKYKTSIRVPKTPPKGTPKRDVYLIRASSDQKSLCRPTTSVQTLVCHQEQESSQACQRPFRDVFPKAVIGTPVTIENLRKK